LKEKTQQFVKRLMERKDIVPQISKKKIAFKVDYIFVYMHIGKRYVRLYHRDEIGWHKEVIRGHNMDFYKRYLKDIKQHRKYGIYAKGEARSFDSY
jgi:hypothetical protein